MLYTKESKEVQVAIDLLSMVEHKSLTVEYKERKAFLTPFIPLLINPQKEHGLKGVSPFAKLLHLLVNFMDADGSGNTLNPEHAERQMHRVRTIQALQRAVSGSMSRNQGIQIVKKRLSHCGWPFLLPKEINDIFAPPIRQT